MQKRAMAALAAALLICLIPVSGFAVVTPFSQDFEGLTLADEGALATDGWLVYGNVFAPGGAWMYGYGTFPAPNNGLGFCQVNENQGGVEQGAHQLVIFSDYENGDHAGGNLIEANTFQEQTITAENVGQTWNFSFQTKRGNLGGSSTAMAFIKTLNPAAGWSVTNFITFNTTAIDTTWIGHTLSIDITPDLVSQILQIGFTCSATLYESSAVFYDNIVFAEYDPSGVPNAATAPGMSLRQNYPNPFNPMTRIEFALEKPGNVDISVYDVAGHRVATLQQGSLNAGEHFVTWTGTTDAGASAAAGQYWYVLKTATGQVAQSMTLVK